MDNPKDTKQQQAVLRHSRSARRVRKLMPAGTRVAAVIGDDPTGSQGTVVRHVPCSDALGGYLVVQWDSGTVGRHTFINLKKLETA